MGLNKNISSIIKPIKVITVIILLYLIVSNLVKILAYFPSNSYEIL